MLEFTRFDSDFDMFSEKLFTTGNAKQLIQGHGPY